MTCLSVLTMVNASKTALQRRSEDISPGDVVLEHLLSPSTIRGTQKEFENRLICQNCGQKTTTLQAILWQTH